MAKRKPVAPAGVVEEIRKEIRRSPRFVKQNDVSLLRGISKNPNLKSGNVSRRSPRIGQLKDTNSLPNPKNPNLLSVRNQARRSSRDRSLLSPPARDNVMANEGPDEISQNEEVRKSFNSELRRSPRFTNSCMDDFEMKSGAKVKRGKESTMKERMCLRRSSRFSNQRINYKEADQKLYSTVEEICGNHHCKKNPPAKKNIKSYTPIRSVDESPHKGEDPSSKNEEKEPEAERRKRKRVKESSEAVQGWTKEQEMALNRAYMTMKPTPSFWKKVSKMVGKSAQECFDRINYEAHTPIPPRIRSRLKNKMSSPKSGFSISASKLLRSPSRKPTRKRKTHLGQKKVRELLQKQCKLEKDYEGDLFSVLEGNVTSPPLKVFHNAPGASTPPPQAMPLKNGSNSFSSRKKCVSRLSKAAMLVSPPVLKQVKNKVMHEKYIDKLHIREAKRKAELTRAKKTTFGKENLPPHSCNKKSNEVKAAKNALESDVRDVILQFQQIKAKALNNSPDEFEDDILVSSDEIEDEL